MCEHREHRFCMSYRFLSGTKEEWREIVVHAHGMTEAFAKLDAWLFQQHPTEAVEVKSYRASYSSKAVAREHGALFGESKLCASGLGQIHPDCACQA